MSSILNGVQINNGLRQIGYHIVKFKELREQRIRDYFIQAAQEILKEQGLKNASVRNIAERAGYSAATLYNYFKDVNELIFGCVEYFQKECRYEIQQKTAHLPNGNEKLKTIATVYFEYFLKHPVVFDLFFLKELPDGHSTNFVVESIFSQLEDLLDTQWDQSYLQSRQEAESRKILIDQLRFQIVGLLLFYLNRGKPDTPAQVKKSFRQQLDAVFS